MEPKDAGHSLDPDVQVWSLGQGREVQVRTGQYNMKRHCILGLCRVVQVEVDEIRRLLRIFHMPESAADQASRWIHIYIYTVYIPFWWASSPNYGLEE